MFNWLFGNRRQWLISRPFPHKWESWLTRNVLHYRYFTELERKSLQAGVRVLIDEKYWEGCSGLAITDEIKVTIAGMASLMLMGIEHDFFQAVQTILVYPTSFGFAGERGWFEGQSRHRGPIILAWDRICEERDDAEAEGNLVIHEFAHQLDEMDGEINGTPYLPDPVFAERWHREMNAEFERHVRDLREGKFTVLGDYAASDDAEFFSVASERFFMLPARLKKRNPVVYDLLVEYYRVKPLDWFSRSPRN